MISASVTREAVASHYDELDHFYRDVWGDHVHHGLWLRGDESREEAVGQLVDTVAREIGLPQEHTSAYPISATEPPLKVEALLPLEVCDIGCGYGATARALALRGAHVTGITISSAQFAVARERTRDRDNPTFILGDWLRNDLPNESFDAAIAIESSEHMPDICLFFAQANRVLRPGGRLVICAWLAAESPGPHAKKWLLEPICREGRMPLLGSESDYHSLGGVAGFELEKFQDVTQFVVRTWPAIVWRLAAKFITSPRYLKFLFSPHAHNRIFAVTIFRIWLAYKTGAMRYGIFTFAKAAAGDLSF